MNTVQQGVTCLLASKKATNRIDINNYKLYVDVDRDDVGDELFNCIHFVDSICLLTNNISISSDLALSDSDFQGQRDDFHNYCWMLQTQYTEYLAHEKEENLNAIYNILITSIFPPYNYSFFPLFNFSSKGESFMKDVKEELISIFALNREGKLEPEEIYLRPQPPCDDGECVEGEKIIRYGVNSEMPRIEVLSSSFIITTVLPLLLMKVHF